MKPYFSIVASATLAGFGSVDIVADKSPEAKSIQYVVMNDILVDEGKKGLIPFECTVSTLRKATDTVPDLKEARVIPVLKGKTTLPLLTHLLTQPVAEDQDQVEIIVSNIEGLTKFFDDNAPATGSYRNVDESVTDRISELFRIIAGVTGEMPESDVVLSKIHSLIEAGRLDACTEFAKLGLDALNQMRLQKARTPQS